MATRRTIALQCPVCGTRFLSTVIDEAGGVVHMSTDFNRRVDGVGAVAYLVDLCAACGFAGPKEDFTTDAVGAASASTLGDVDVATDPTMAVSPSEKYEAAAAVAERRGEPPRVVADLLLRAAWCCETERDTEAERYFRRAAARRYEEALARYDDVPADGRAELTYLVGELWRRVGDRARARAWLDRVASEVLDAREQGWLVSLAEQQRDRPREWLATGEWPAAA
jgi:hypothetical protein